MTDLHDKARLWQARSKNTRYKGQIQEADEIIAALLAEVERLELAIKRQAAAAKQLHSAERALISADRDAAEKARKLTDSKALNGILEANDRLTNEVELLEKQRDRLNMSVAEMTARAEAAEASLQALCEAKPAAWRWTDVGFGGSPVVRYDDECPQYVTDAVPLIPRPSMESNNG